MSEDVSDLIGVDEAIRVIDQTPVSPRVISVRLEDAQGLRLAEDVLADRDYPPFDKSLMDGYAVRTIDVSQTPTDLEVIATLTAGQRPATVLQTGQAIAIMTGAPIPPGADTVVPVEDVEFLLLPLGEGRGEGMSEFVTTKESEQSLTPLSQREREKIRILRAANAGHAIARRGSDCLAGTTVLRRGVKLESAQLAVAASVGAASVSVFARPRVAVLATGDEIVPIDATPTDAKIRNANSILLISLLRRLGCDTTDLGTAGDDPAVIRDAIHRGLAFDALFVTGGMSVGRHDFVPRVLIELGVDLKITKLRIKPGKPFVFGVKSSPSLAVSRSIATPAAKPQADGSVPATSFVFGLPGNPVSGFVCTLRLCSRLLARLAGATQLDRWIEAKLESPLDKNGPREFYQPAILHGPGVTPLKWKGSADVYTLAAANALIRRPENAPALPTGERVEVLEIPA